MNDLIIYGNTILSKMVLEDAYDDKTFRIAAIAVDPEYLDGDTFYGLPQVDVRKIAIRYPTDQYDLLAILGGYSDIRSRSRFLSQALALGYRLRNYVSLRADVSRDVKMGVNNIILAQAHVGLDGCMGDNNLIRQNVYLGHGFDIGDHNVLGPGSNIGGGVRMGTRCYICMGSTVIDHITIADETLVGAGSVVIRNTEAYSKNVGNPSRILGYHKEEGIRMKVRSGEQT